MKRILTVLLIFAVLLSLPLAASAHDVPQERSDCSLEITVRYNDKDITGGTLTAIRVGYVDQEDGNYFFSREYDGKKLEDIQSSAAPAELLAFYNANKTNYTFATKTVTVSSGKAVFTDLPTGLYLIVQNQAASGYTKLSPFLVGLPYMDQSGVYQYSLTMAVKSELEREPENTVPPPTTTPSGGLPQTGQLNWPVPVMACCGMALFAAGWLLCFRGRRKASDES